MKFERMTKKQLVGRRVVTTRSMSNGWGTIPPGATMTITGKFKGLSLRSEPCSCCKVTMFMSKVAFYDVRLLPAEEK